MFPYTLATEILSSLNSGNVTPSHGTWFPPPPNLNPNGLNEDENFPNFQKPFHKIYQDFAWVLELKASPSLLWSWGIARVSSLNLEVGGQIGRGG